MNVSTVLGVCLMILEFIERSRHVRRMVWLAVFSLSFFLIASGLTILLKALTDFWAFIR